MKKLLLIFCATFLITSCGGGSAKAPSLPTDIPIAIEGIEGDTDVGIDATFKHEFSKAIDTNTVTEETFFIMPTPEAEANLVQLKAAYDADICDIENALDAEVACTSSTVCTLDPTDDLSENTEYSICLVFDDETSGIMYLDGDPFEGLLVQFTTDGEEEEIPDISGIYISDNPSDCIGNVMITETSTENEYEFHNTENLTLTMTEATTCEVEATDRAATCSYETDEITLSVTSPFECTSVLTKGSAVCDDSSCDVSEGETFGMCPSDCGVASTDVSFMAETNWSTTSPANDCFVDVTDGSDLDMEVIEIDEEDFLDNHDIIEGYYIIPNTPGQISNYTIAIYRISDNYCFVVFGPAGNSEDCAPTAACSASGITATCELEGNECTLDLE